MRPLQNVSSEFGAPMGRPDNICNTDYPVQFELERLKWVDGDYDVGGAYWGRPDNDYIYRAEGESPDALECVFVRGRSLDEVKAEIIKIYPQATFSKTAELEEFLSAYRETALAISPNDFYEENMEEENEYLADSGREVSPECDAALRRHCEAFLEAHGALVAEATEGPDYTLAQAGSDFWLTRNGHGVGYLDRNLDEVGVQLDDAACAFKEVNLYIGDDNQIHCDDENFEPRPAPGP
ncbi:hypothetical protein [Thalassospira xiamenensis]|nr:hypothetical protein [Thalassospira xiamenensis]